MTKLVNIILHGRAITCLKHPITRNMDNIYLTTADIKKILQTSNATVREVFPDGSVYDLTLENCERGDLFEVAKQEKAAQREAKKAADSKEAKIQADIQARKDARNQALANLRGTNTTNAGVQTNAVQTNSTVEAARAQIEANKGI